MQASTIVIIILALGFLAYIGWRYSNQDKSEQEEIATAKLAYDEAIKSGDRKAALEAGRRYYSLLRGGKLSVYDEQAITNDLNAMS